ncbi:MAG: XTP/dITP diphosphatase [Thermoplasmata archaeon]|nr:XTP/dITP diphosphatase [Thermoplasmata archaeon]
MMIYFITGNRHKYVEAKKIIDDIEMKHIPYPEIQADSLEEVAKFGIDYLKNKIEAKFFLEDSGLFIDALKGFPGVYSAYVFKTIGNDGILKLMEGKKERKAYFKAVIAYYDGSVHIFQGICYGEIAMEKRGEGFGYDPIFVPEGSKKTFGEMSKEEKNKYSHRGKALMAFKKFLNSQ